MSEKKEKKKPESVHKNLTRIQLALVEASRANSAIMRTSVIQAMQASARISKIFDQSTIGLQTMIKAQAQLNKMAMKQARLLQAFQVPQVLKAVVAHEKNALGLAAEYSRIQQSIQKSISLPSLETHVRAIAPRTDTTMKSLLNYVEFLEKELTKEKAKNKELLRILEELKKEIKKQYVV